MHFAGDLSEKEELRNSQKSEKARRPSPLQRRKDMGDTWKKPVNYRAESPLKSKSPSPPRRKKRSYEHERRSRNPEDLVGKHLYGRDAVEGGRVRFEELGAGGGASKSKNKKDCTVS